MPLTEPGHRRPADQRRHGAGGAADHDVLRRAALQPDRVDEHVAEEAGEGQRGGQRVDRQRELDQRQAREHAAEQQRRARGDAARGDRPGGRALHLRVDVAVEPVVDGAGAARREVAAEAGQRDEAGRGVAGDVHRRDRRQQQQRLDLGLGQLEVVGEQLARARRRARRAPRRAPRPAAPARASAIRRPPAARRPGTVAPLPGAPVLRRSTSRRMSFIGSAERTRGTTSKLLTGGGEVREPLERVAPSTGRVRRRRRGAGCARR